MTKKHRVRWDGKHWRWLKHYVFRDCPFCGRARIMGFSGGCEDCRQVRRLERLNVCSRAHAKVHKAIEAGELPVLDGSIPCVDCGKPAKVYDHREYARPLDVEPVCVGCNLKRGPAIDSGARVRSAESRAA